MPNTPSNTTTMNPQILQTLTANGIINKGVNVDQLIAASSAIGTLVGVANAEWTFVSPNYVYKGASLKQGAAVINVETHENILKALSTNGVINKATTLDQIVAASGHIGVSAGVKAGDWTFISHNYVYTGGNIAAASIASNPAAR